MHKHEETNLIQLNLAQLKLAQLAY